MKIHLLSDIHLESGAYALPENLECDVIVAAGDIGNGTEGVKWLKSLGKPVVYVLGNHDYWSDKDSPVDMFDVIAQVKAEAAGSNVHFLQNDSVVIDGVRFLGATLWTNFGKFNPSLIAEAKSFMGDYRHIFCPKFYAKESNLKEFYRLADDYLFRSGRANEGFKEGLKKNFVDRGQFHPFVAYFLHSQSVRWFDYQLTDQAGFEGKTVIVTHHHPSYDSLRKSGVAESWLVPSQEYRAGGREPNGDLCTVAAYASDVPVHNWRYMVGEPDRSRVSAWMCGHIHHHLDYLHEGMRVVSNPRGRYSGPLTLEKAQSFAWFGYSISPKDIEESQQRIKENPYLGDGVDFDASFIVDLDEGLTPVLRPEIDAVVPTLESLHADIAEFAAHVAVPEPVVAKAVRESIQVRADDFLAMTENLQKKIQKNLGGVQMGIAVNLYFYQRPYRKSPDFDTALSGPEEEIAALLRGQQIALQKLAELPAHLERCQYRFNTFDLYGATDADTLAEKSMPEE